MNERNKQQTLSLKKRKISKKLVAKWNILSDEHMVAIMSLFEDAMETFTGSNDEMVEKTLRKIQRRVAKRLKKLYVPDMIQGVDLFDLKPVESSKASLTSELERLKTQEETSRQNFKKSSREVQSLEEMLEKLKDTE